MHLIAYATIFTPPRRVAPTPTPAARRPAAPTPSAARTGRVRWSAPVDPATWAIPPHRPAVGPSAWTTASAPPHSRA